MACGGLLAFRHDLIYPFRDWPVADQVSGLPGAVVREVTAPDGVSVITWQVPPQKGQPYILHFTGNAGSLPSSGPKLTELAVQGHGIIAMNYRGAGGATGEPSQTQIVADALAVHDAIADGPVVVYGTSLGAAVAVQVAAQRTVRALILETPFANMCETAEHHYPLIPACWLLWDERWESRAAITTYQGPLLILHGDADRIVPISEGRKLFDAANEPKEFVTYPGGRHNDLRLHGSGQEILRFLKALPRG
ncbi:MAG: alpha/beta fold hydrolase [Pseudomonadota bacterium]